MFGFKLCFWKHSTALHGIQCLLFTSMSNSKFMTLNGQLFAKGNEYQCPHKNQVSIVQSTQTSMLNLKFVAQKNVILIQNVLRQSTWTCMQNLNSIAQKMAELWMLVQKRKIYYISKWDKSMIRAFLIVKCMYVSCTAVNIYYIYALKFVEFGSFCI